MRRQVYARLFPGRGEHESVHAQPDWPVVHRELARVGVTLKLLHGEYVDQCRAEGATAMGYDRFCKNYQQHVLISGAASRIGHKAGQSVEVDWSGPTMQLTDPVTGCPRRHSHRSAGSVVHITPLNTTQTGILTAGKVSPPPTVTTLTPA